MDSHYIDEDTTDAFLDAPDMRYQDGTTGAEMAHEAAEAAITGNVKPPPLPPLTDR